MRYFILLFIISASTAINVWSQELSSKFTKELGFISENDSYLLNEDDGYYTNGIGVYLNWKGRDTLRINTLKIGQNIYNAQNGDYSKIEDIDRPVTGYLYLTYEQTRFTSKKDMLSWSISAGAIGSSALGKETQVLMHKVLGMYDPKEEWDFQLKSSVGLNAEIRWVREIALIPKLELQMIGEARGGFFFNNLKVGTLVRWGRFNKNTHTVFWNTRLNTDNKKERNEKFFYFQPSISLYAYNATVQGRIFSNDKGLVTGNLTPFLYTHKIGFMSSWNRVALNLVLNYQTKETPSQIRTQWYGTIELKYLLK